ncbi:hypothetical protein [Brevibacillus daliensis]|uniref:hypothetical protein n=1 Tax=Brevibacillus daliensis TaxID=2892995 RepID=UPI001E49EA9C|nr:hypothetical protein [Brevibacillus daliensis]
MKRTILLLISFVVTIVLLYFLHFVPPLGFAYFMNIGNLERYLYATMVFFPIILIGYLIGKSLLLPTFICSYFYYYAEVAFDMLSSYVLAAITAAVLVFLVKILCKKIFKIKGF